MSVEAKCMKCLIYIEVGKNIFNAQFNLPCGCTINGSQEVSKYIKETIIDFNTSGTIFH